jgi:hypothetical protein
MMTAHSYTGLRAYLARQEEDYGHLGAKAQRDGKASTSTAKPAPSRSSPLAGMSAVDILGHLTAPQRAGLAAALASPAKPSKATKDPEAEYQRGVTNGRAAERTRVRTVYDKAKVQGGDAAALRLLATTDLDSAAINAELFGRDTSLVDAMKARFKESAA